MNEFVVRKRGGKDSMFTLEFYVDVKPHFNVFNGNIFI